MILPLLGERAGVREDHNYSGMGQPRITGEFVIDYKGVRRF